MSAGLGAGQGDADAHAWMPTSPCGDSCLTTGEPSVGGFRRAVRYTAAVSLVCATLIVSPLVVLGGRVRTVLVRTVFRGVFKALGIRLLVHDGEALRAAGRGALVVNNHISWLDIMAVNAVQPMRALAKREVGQWPVLGTLVARGGSIFLDRERLSTLPDSMAELAEAMRSGAQVNVSPEGTTWCGRASGRFATATFQAAIDGGVPVRPVALRYRDGDGRETTRPAFIGPESLIDSLRRVAAMRGLVLEMYVCQEIAPGRAADRREVAALAESAVHSALGTVRIPAQRRRVVSRPMTGAPAGSVAAQGKRVDTVG